MGWGGGGGVEPILNISTSVLFHELQCCIPKHMLNSCLSPPILRPSTKEELVSRHLLHSFWWVPFSCPVKKRHFVERKCMLSINMTGHRQNSGIIVIPLSFWSASGQKNDRLRSYFQILKELWNWFQGIDSLKPGGPVWRPYSYSVPSPRGPPGPLVAFVPLAN